MTSKPLIIFDPYPRNKEMVFTSDVEKELNQITNLVSHFGNRAPNDLVEKNISDVEIIVGQTSMPKERLDEAKKLKAIIKNKEILVLNHGTDMSGMRSMLNFASHHNAIIDLSLIHI